MSRLGSLDAAQLFTESNKQARHSVAEVTHAIESKAKAKFDKSEITQLLHENFTDLSPATLGRATEAQNVFERGIRQDKTGKAINKLNDYLEDKNAGSFTKNAVKMQAYANMLNSPINSESHKRWEAVYNRANAQANQHIQRGFDFLA